jgi:UDP-N-acetylmuramoyl-L-alanyl-D-glutamate--2,6-diaminopimelate ligase
MILRELLAESSAVTGDESLLQAEITAVELDSRRARPGAVFLALARTEAERAGHIIQARGAGAAAVIGPTGSAADIVVADPALVAAELACAFYRHPSRELTVIAVTGTNGKSSITHTASGVLRTLGARVGTIGTIGITLDGQVLEVQRRTPTTPESIDLQALLRQFAHAGATHVVMEASSIALAERRLDGTAVSIGCFTNLTHDHLDVHATMAAYEAAKLLLFDFARRAIANVDDPVGAHVAGRRPTRTYALHHPADIAGAGVRAEPGGTSFTVHHDGATTVASIRSLGGFSVSNALAVLAICAELGTDIDDAITALAAQPGVPGRMQVVPIDRPYTVMIDYAHSPDSLEQVLRTLRAGTSGRILTVVGCGGDRDRAKRPVMGRIASALSDIAIITTDNPRTEDPDQIIAEILAGVGEHRERVRVIAERTDAIAAALATATSGDVVLVAGKGDEPYQLVGQERIPYSDEATILALAGTATEGHREADSSTSKRGKIAAVLGCQAPTRVQ